MSARLKPLLPKNPSSLEGQLEPDLIQPMTLICTIQDATTGTMMTTNNHFSVLMIEEPEPPVSEPTTQVEPPKEWSPCLPPLLKWERWLLKHFVIAANPSTNSSELPVLMQTTDMSNIHLTKGLLDCGVSDMFMSSDFMKQKHLMMKLLTHPIPVYNVNGTLNEAGSISEVINVMLWYCDHSECVTFAVTSIGTHNLILGLNWLWKQPGGRLGYKQSQNESLPKSLSHLSKWIECWAKSIIQRSHK